VQEDARAVAEAQPQIATTRIALDDILAKLDDSDGVMKTWLTGVASWTGPKSAWLTPTP
jgi:hypothetical protein